MRNYDQQPQLNKHQSLYDKSRRKKPVEQFVSKYLEWEALEESNSIQYLDLE